MNKKLIGILCAIGAAVCYGTNPLGALNLYAEGMNTPSVLFYRFGLAWLIVAVVMLFRRESLKVDRREFLTLTALGVLFIFSSLTLYLSFHLMPAGVASTILFTYPVMTAAIMAAFFRERIRVGTVLSILLSFAGVLLLYWGDSGGTLHIGGVILVLVSALTYALYIIVVDKSPLAMSSFKINFYVLFYCAAGMALFALLSGQPLQLPPTPGLCRQVYRLHADGHPRGFGAHHSGAHRCLRLCRALHLAPSARHRPHPRRRDDCRPCQRQ